MSRSGNSTDEGGTCKRLCDFGLRFDVMDDIGDDSCRVEKIVGDGLGSCHNEFLCFGTACMMP